MRDLLIEIPAKLRVAGPRDFAHSAEGLLRAAGGE